MRPRLLTIAWLAALLSGALGCESSPMDMWITMNPDAGWDFDAPVREVQPPATDGALDAPDGTIEDAGNGGAGGTAGSGGGGSGGSAGTTGAAGDGAGGDTGTGGASGSGGAAGSN